MLTFKNSENLCNMLFNNLLDIYNDEPTRLDIISFFLEKFDYVRLTLYDDIIVFCEIDSQAVFISQLGVFRYKDTLTKQYLSVNKYLSMEHYFTSIVLDIYATEEYDEKKSPYKLKQLIGFNDNSKSGLEFLDNTLTTTYLNSLLEYLSLYLDTILKAKKYYPNILG